MKSFLDFIERHAKGVIIAVALITLIMLALASRIVLNADYNMFLPWGDDTDYYMGGVPGQEVNLSRGNSYGSGESEEEPITGTGEEDAT